MKKTFLAAGAILAAAVTSSNAAFTTFFGEDLNNSSNSVLTLLTNSNAAETNFLNNLLGVGTETFESLSGAAPQSLVFPGAGTATLTGGSGSVVTLGSSNVSNGSGRYGITRDGGTEGYWQVDAGGGGNFVINFSQPIAAFGFYGIDIGDFGGTLQLSLTGGSNTVLNVPNTQGNNASSDGSVFFYGFVNPDPSQLVSSISFQTSTGNGDVFAFDDMTIGSIQQINPNPPTNNVPDGGTTAALLGASLAGLAGLRRKFKA